MAAHAIDFGHPMTICRKAEPNTKNECGQSRNWILILTLHIFYIQQSNRSIKHYGRIFPGTNCSVMRDGGA